MKWSELKKRKRLKFAIILSLVFIWSIAGFFRYINSPKFQSIIYSSINKISSLHIESAKLNLNILKREASITDLNLYNAEKKQRFTADRVYVKFSLLPLLKASLSISNLETKNLKIEIGEKTSEEQKHRSEISLSNLLILRNLTLRNSSFSKTTIILPKTSINIDNIDIKYIPSIWGKIDLYTRIDGANIAPQNKSPLTIEELNIKGSTDIYEWQDIFPYVDDLAGLIQVKNLIWRNLAVDKINTNLKYSRNVLKINSSDASISGHLVQTSGSIDINTQEYSLNIDIPEPISLPSIGNENTFIDTKGDISGKISITGSGLNYKTMKATADISLKHTLGKGTPLPAELTGMIAISDGQISTSKIKLQVGETLVNVDGSFNYIEPNIKLNFSADNVPSEAVMNRFLNKHYHPTRGLASAKGTVTGWGKDIIFNLSVLATDAYYYEIFAERAEMDLSITYSDLILKGRVFQGDAEKGNIILDMKMGKKLADGSREKYFKLNASVNDFDLSPSMTAYQLSGKGTGSITLEGRPEAFFGSGTMSIEEGSFKGIGFENIKSDVQFKPRQLVFNNISASTSDTNPANFSSPVILDITDYGIRFHGTPRTGIDIDAAYNSTNGSWNIKNILYTSDQNDDWRSSLSGTLDINGNLNMNISGMLDTALLGYLRGYIREIKGPIELKKIHIGGTSENPALSGSIRLENNNLQFRNWGYYFDRLTGTIDLNGHQISTKELSGRIEYGDFTLKGKIEHNKFLINNVDISFIGRSILYATQDHSFRMEFDTDLSLKGSPASSSLAGKINIIDGRYIKNFSIFDSMKKGRVHSAPPQVSTEWKNMKLDLRIKSNGDLKIDNNIGEIWLDADLHVTGLEKKPNITGNVETLGGEVHYAGIEFEVTRGYVEFRDPYTNPFMEFTASKEVGNYNITLNAKGRVDKIYFDLNSTPPLEKRDILALLTFGITEEDLKETQFGYQLSTGLVAEQVGAVLQQPVTKFTPLDRFRIEASPNSGGSGEVTRLYMGKDISDRLKLNFITDINSSDSQQTFQAEYLLTDFMLLKGSRMSNNQYRFHLSFRFRER